MSDSEDKSPGKKPGSGGRGKPGSPDRRARGFQRAGGLIDAQLRTNSAKRGFAQARLASLWADVIGPDGIVYPNWTQCGIEGGIPSVPTRTRIEEHGGRADAACATASR